MEAIILGLVFVVLFPLIIGYIEDWVVVSFIVDSLNGVITLFYFLLGIVCMFGGVTIIAVQVYLYLKQGYWVSYSIIDGLIEIDPLWQIYPNDWVGLYEICKKIPLNFSLFVLGVYFYMFRDSHIYFRG